MNKRARESEDLRSSNPNSKRHRVVTERHASVPDPLASHDATNTQMFNYMDAREARIAQLKNELQLLESSGETQSTLPSPAVTPNALRPQELHAYDYGTYYNINPPSSEIDGSYGDDSESDAGLAEPEIVLSGEQQNIVRLAEQGRNIFYTGSAGCGKSAVLHAIRKALRLQGKNVQVMAPTGMAALAIDGQTTWSYAGITPDSLKSGLDGHRGLRQLAKSEKNSKRFLETDVIIIDEVSMVESNFFHRFNELMKSGRNDKRPFGGVQVIVTGDFCQLPPVHPFQTCGNCGKELERSWPRSCTDCRLTYHESDKWAFRSEAWKECDFVHVHLMQIHRQSDGEFKNILEKCRLGIPLTQAEKSLLLQGKQQQPLAQVEGSKPVKLFPRVDDVNKENKNNFNKLDTPVHEYQSHDRLKDGGLESSRRTPYHSPAEKKQILKRFDKNSRFDRDLELRKGMPVVLLVNLDLSADLCNGSQGVIVDFERFDWEKLPRKKKGGDSEPRNVIAGTHAGHRAANVEWFAKNNAAPSQQGGRESTNSLQNLGGGDETPLDIWWPVVRFHNGRVATIYPHCSLNEVGTKEPYSLLSRTQIPLAAAWALTIHKAQGMTLSRVMVDLTRSFETGQVYVALSRATSLEGLKVIDRGKGLDTKLGGDQTVREFLMSRFPAVKEQIDKLQAAKAVVKGEEAPQPSIRSFLSRPPTAPSLATSSSTVRYNIEVVDLTSSDKEA